MRMGHHEHAKILIIFIRPTGAYEPLRPMSNN